MSILIKNGYVVYGENFEIIEADVLIEDNRIVKVAKGINESADTVIDAKGRVVSPAFVNLHTHSPMGLFRGLADDLPLMDWLQNHIWPREAKLTREYTKVGAYLGALEMIKGGTSTFLDMYFFMDAVAEVVLESGLRGYLSYGMIDLGDPEKTEKELKEALRVMEFIEKLGSDRVHFVFGPHAPYTCSIALLREVRRLANEHGKLITIHVSETMAEIGQISERYGKSPVVLLDEIGFFGSDVIIAHGVWLDSRDIQILARHGVTVAHNPGSNMKLASGVMPLQRLLNAGVNVGLGTDGSASNNNLDMLDEMKLAALLHKVHNLDPTVADAKTVFRMATLNGARALHLNAGVIKEGYLADIAIIDFNQPHLRPINNVISHLVYSATGSDVETTIVDGKILMLDREVLTLDEEKIIDEAEKTIEKLA
ncbi:amidohydrolase family protein [Thermococcus thioreducens]|uniref:5-methylthioadenosine/S-adenosylhomocysteine deaminase n=1 Tax=Thermococcus thioreducens TaxID=277988 RepID=A0A0Q2S859_9EURY|nr:amidohydrolase family protein [Thermococcus thioreducens]ASJ11391.1 N-ethylammeline chlorohydrolase [Thermococcus thioreducens]KQH83411.1 N-ethylammeline chlorohydrolase [Thermococcus thioreducens]SEW07491.1 5-methylthioadenosine/S-adenosylhomocysteine deaminase [Thermococcus thioreducens]